MKYGIEVEGRFRGFPTFFVLNEEDLALLWSKTTNFLRDFEKVRHVNVYDVDSNLIYDERLKRLSIFYTITLESDTYPIIMPDYIDHFVLQIDNSDFWNLRSHDSIKFVDGLSNVKMICVENMNTTLPNELINDIKIK